MSASLAYCAKRKALVECKPRGTPNCIHLCYAPVALRVWNNTVGHSFTERYGSISRPGVCVLCKRRDATSDVELKNLNHTKMEKINNYLTERINYLKGVEVDYFNQQYEQPKESPLRMVYRNLSNEFMARRQELEDVVEFLSEAERN